MSLDVGLDEFPEVLPEGDGVDVDADGELGAKLDLARAYLEIDDKSSAIELLNEVMANGTSQQKDEAQRFSSAWLERQTGDEAVTLVAASFLGRISKRNRGPK